MAPKPTPLRATPSPGSQTAPATLSKPAEAWEVAGTGRMSATRGKTTRGINVAAIAIAAKPKCMYKAVPAGAPIANAA